MNKVEGKNPLPEWSDDFLITVFVLRPPPGAPRNLENLPKSQRELSSFSSPEDKASLLISIQSTNDELATD